LPVAALAAELIGLFGKSLLKALVVLQFNPITVL